MNVRMLERALGQDRDKNGIACPVKTYHKDEIYPVGESLGKAFLAMNLATTELEPQSEPSPKNSKAKKAQTKAAKGAPENK